MGGSSKSNLCIYLVMLMVTIMNLSFAKHLCCVIILVTLKHLLNLVPALVVQLTKGSIEAHRTQ